MSFKQGPEGHVYDPDNRLCRESLPMDPAKLLTASYPFAHSPIANTVDHPSPQSTSDEFSLVNLIDSFVIIDGGLSSVHPTARAVTALINLATRSHGHTRSSLAFRMRLRMFGRSARSYCPSDSVEPLAMSLCHCLLRHVPARVAMATPAVQHRTPRGHI